MNTNTTPSGLKYTDEVVGTGASPKPGKSVTVHYTGRLADGKKFDSSHDRNKPFAFAFGVGQVIKGWTEGLQLMTEGDKFKFYIPAELAYGENAPPSIGPNQVLVFDVELVEVLGGAPATFKP